MTLASLDKDLRGQFREDGAVVVPSFLSAEDLAQVNQELDPWLGQIAFNGVMGYVLRFGDRWLDHVGLVSPTLLHAAVNESVLDFVANYFGEEPVVSEFGLHYSTCPNPELSFHSDGAGGIVFYILLSEMTAENGMLEYIPGTQEDDRGFMIPPEAIAERAADIRPFPVRAGDALFFHMNVWHRRAPGAPGRKVVRLSYLPQSRESTAFDLVIRQSFVSGLSERQLRALGIGGDPFGKPGHLKNAGRQFTRADVRDLITYARRHRNSQLGKRKV